MATMSITEERKYICAIKVCGLWDCTDVENKAKAEECVKICAEKIDFLRHLTQEHAIKIMKGMNHDYVPLRAFANGIGEVEMTYEGNYICRAINGTQMFEPTKEFIQEVYENTWRSWVSYMIKQHQLEMNQANSKLEKVKA